MRWMSKLRPMRFALLAAGVLALGIASADARPGGGGSFGSRGSKSFSAPPPTATVPRTAAPTTGMAQKGPRAAAATPAGSRFGSGFGGLLMGGLLGAGLFGLLSGSGLFGGLSGLAGMLGLMLQVALIGGLIYLAMSFFRSRNQQPAMAAAGNRAGMMNREATSPVGSIGARPPVPQPVVPATSDVTLAGEDYSSFEGLLAGIQDAYGREDLKALRTMATPEMVANFSDEIETNQRKNVHNLTSDAKLLEGDLSESWGEEGYEYATVAMRYSLLETTVERGTGRVISGSSDRPIEVAELWTFVRRAGSGARGWQLSAIQQPG